MSTANPLFSLNMRLKKAQESISLHILIYKQLKRLLKRQWICTKKTKILYFYDSSAKIPKKAQKTQLSHQTTPLKTCASKNDTRTGESKSESRTRWESSFTSISFIRWRCASSIFPNACQLRPCLTSQPAYKC